MCSFFFSYIHHFFHPSFHFPTWNPNWILITLFAFFQHCKNNFSKNKSDTTNYRFSCCKQVIIKSMITRAFYSIIREKKLMNDLHVEFNKLHGKFYAVIEAQWNNWKIILLHVFLWNKMKTGRLLIVHEFSWFQGGILSKLSFLCN